MNPSVQPWEVCTDSFLFVCAIDPYIGTSQLYFSCQEVLAHLTSRREQWFLNTVSCVYFRPWAVVPHEIAFESSSRNPSREMLVNFDLRSPTNMSTSNASIDGKWKLVWPIYIHTYMYICNLVLHVKGFGIVRYNCNILHTGALMKSSHITLFILQFWLKFKHIIDTVHS